MKYLYLHGLGQTKDSWDRVVNATNELHNSICLNLAEMDFSDSLQKVTCPVLLVCGENDKANKKAAEELNRYLSHSSFHEILGTGHEVNREAPEKLAALLQEFYEGIF